LLRFSAESGHRKPSLDRHALAIGAAGCELGGFFVFCEATFAVYLGGLCDYGAILTPGEVGTVLVIAPDQPVNARDFHRVS
jgi:hypothetical protein